MAADLVDLPPPPSRKSSSDSNGASKAPSSLLPSPEAASSSSASAPLVAALLASAASTDRGAGGTRRERAAVEALAAKLERLSKRRRAEERRRKESGGEDDEGGGGAPSPSCSSPSPSSSSSRLEDLLKGRWSLVYSSAQPFRSSPFFWGFSKAMGSVAAAEAVFAFTEALPFARIGTARQEVTESSRRSSAADSDSNGSGSSSFSSSSSSEDLLWITSDVGLTVAGASGRVVTESSASVVVESGNDDYDDDNPSPILTLSVRPVSTRVEGSTLLPGPLGKTRVPVGEALDAMAWLTGRVMSGGGSGGGGSRGGSRGGKGESNGGSPFSSSSPSSSCATLLEISYLDDSLRIGRTPRDGHLFVYAREQE